ncbi:MAG: hypothetical protein GEU80_00855 [Dehalococcoidia bacterium]|nr:hypothetical protein [Dehalococcoidia bacterium]
MLYLSILTLDRERDPELWATIWQGHAPHTLKLHAAYNLGGDKRVFVWEGESAADLQFMDRFNEVGQLETAPVFDRTEGWRDAFAGDLERFASRMGERATTPAGEAALDLRRRGLEAPNSQTARRRAREWVEEQEYADQ